MDDKLNLAEAADLLAELINNQRLKGNTLKIIRAGGKGALPVYWFNDTQITTCLARFNFKKGKDGKLHLNDLRNSYSYGPMQLHPGDLQALAASESTIVIAFEFTRQDLEKLKILQKKGQLGGGLVDGKGNRRFFLHPATPEGTVTINRDQLFVYESDLRAYADTLPAAPEVDQEQTKQPKPAGTVAVPKERANEARIIGLLQLFGYNPLTLPPREKGKAGVKARIRASALADKPATLTKSSFNHAWQRLRNNGEIAGGK